MWDIMMKRYKRSQGLPTFQGLLTDDEEVSQTETSRRQAIHCPSRRQASKASFLLGAVEASHSDETKRLGGGLCLSRLSLNLNSETSARKSSRHNVVP